MCTVVRELPPGITVVAWRCSRAECESGSAYRLVTERALLVWIVMDPSSSRGFTAPQVTDHHRSARRACQHHEALIVNYCGGAAATQIVAAPALAWWRERRYKCPRPATPRGGDHERTRRSRSVQRPRRQERQH